MLDEDRKRMRAWDALMGGRTDRREAGSADWVLFGLAAFALTAASGWLVWVLWRRVPAQLDVYLARGLALPLSTRLAIAASNWFIRLLPLLIIGGLPAAIIAGGRALRVLERGAQGEVRAWTIAMLAVAMVLGGACVAVLLSLRAPYHAAAGAPPVGSVQPPGGSGDGAVRRVRHHPALTVGA